MLLLLFSFLSAASCLRLSHLASCGKTRGCWTLPAGCSGNECAAVISWQHQGKAVIMEIEAKIRKGPVGSWIGFGISRDDRMGNDTVLECHFQTGRPGSVHLSHNVQNSNIILPAASDYLLKDSFVEESEGKFWCGTEWILDYTILQKDEKQMLHRLNSGKWTLFYAFGDLDPVGQKKIHAIAGIEAPWKSAETVRFCLACPSAFQIVDEHLVVKV